MSNCGAPTEIGRAKISRAAVQLPREIWYSRCDSSTFWSAQKTTTHCFHKLDYEVRSS